MDVRHCWSKDIDTVDFFMYYIGQNRGSRVKKNSLNQGIGLCRPEFTSYDQSEILRSLL